MANLAVTASEVSLVRNDPDDQITLPANVVLDKGTHVKIDGTTGHWVKAIDTDVATTQTYITIESAIAAGYTVTAIRKGIIDLGDALSGLAYGARVWASATAGVLADAATAASAAVGEVMPATAERPYAKLLKVDL
jgi:hypothetical protein